MRGPRPRARAATTEAHELIDPTLSGERLLFRLFNERGVRVYAPTPLAAAAAVPPRKSSDAALLPAGGGGAGDGGRRRHDRRHLRILLTKRTFNPADYGA